MALPTERRTALTKIATEAGLYSAAEFREAVLALEPRVAVFDCDGTLWEPDSGYGFMRWTLEPAHRLLPPERQIWMDQRYALYGSGDIDEATICGDMVQLYAGLSEATLRASAREYFTERVQPQIFADMAALVAALHASGTEIWAVSSTSNWVVEAGVRVFDIPAERVLAAEVKIENGLATERLLRVPTDEGKRDALLSAGVDRPDAVFGNSIHDAAMLEMAAHAFPVNANDALTALARSRGWRIFRP
jgi:phosphoserine phosphatase